MWLCLNKGFLSIVKKDCKSDELMVRARQKGHILAVFPDAKVCETFGTDYSFRAVVKTAEVKAAVCREIDGIQYPNFKDSVVSNSLYYAYSAVWKVMARLQARTPYSRRDSGQKGLL